MDKLKSVARSLLNMLLPWLITSLLIYICHPAWWLGRYSVFSSPVLCWFFVIRKGRPRECITTFFLIYTLICFFIVVFWLAAFGTFGLFYPGIYYS